MVNFKISTTNPLEDRPIEVRLVQAQGSVKIKLGPYTVAELTNGALHFHQYGHGSPGLKEMQSWGVLFTRLSADRYRVRTGGLN